MKTLHAIAARVGVSLAISALVVFPFLFLIHQGADRHQHVTDQPVSPMVAESTKVFAKRLNVPAPAIKITTLPGRGWAYCSNTPGDCEIHLGSRFDSDLASEEAKRSVIAHEMGHVLQSVRGERFYSLSDGFLFLVVASLVALFTGQRWWISSSIGFSAVVWVGFLNGVSQTDPMIFNVILIFLGWLVFLLLSAAIQLSREKLQRAALALACTSLIGVTWANLRGFDDHQKKLEREADLVSVCLVGKSARKLSLQTGEKYEHGGFLPDLYHPTIAERIAAVNAYDMTKCVEFLSH